MKIFGTVLLSAAISVAASNVVTDWNTIASTAIVKNGGKSAGGSAMWFAYTSLAVYDAVNAITGQYRTFYYRGTGSQTASVEACLANADAWRPPRDSKDMGSVSASAHNRRRGARQPRVGAESVRA